MLLHNKKNNWTKNKEYMNILKFCEKFRFDGLASGSSANDKISHQDTLVLDIQLQYALYLLHLEQFVVILLSIIQNVFACRTYPSNGIVGSLTRIRPDCDFCNHLCYLFTCYSKAFADVTVGRLDLSLCHCLMAGLDFQRFLNIPVLVHLSS